MRRCSAAMSASPFTASLHGAAVQADCVTWQSQALCTLLKPAAACMRSRDSMGRLAESK